MVFWSWTDTQESSCRRGKTSVPVLGCGDDECDPLAATGLPIGGR